MHVPRTGTQAPRFDVLLRVWAPPVVWTEGRRWAGLEKESLIEFWQATRSLEVVGKYDPI